MASKLYRNHLYDAASAALAGLQTAVESSTDCDRVVLAAVLERVGDLQRLEERPPTWCAPWLNSVTESDLAHVLADYLAETASWPVPEGRVTLQTTEAPDDEFVSDDGLAFALQRRDEVESAQAAIMRLSLKRGRAPIELTGWGELAAATRAWESALATVLDRATAETLLGERVILSERHGWLAHLPDRVTPSEGDETTAATFAREDGIGEPDDEALHTYLRSGELQTYIEGYAAETPAFAEILAMTISSLRDLGELGTAIAPRLWLKRYEQRANEAIHYIVPSARLAAADTQRDAAQHDVDLGTIAGLATTINVSLHLVGAKVILRVDADGELKEVRIGDGACHSANADGCWEAECVRTGAPLTIRIEDCVGGVFQDALVFDAEG